MATESSETVRESETTAVSLSRSARALLQCIFSGFLAALGTIALIHGIRTYLEFATQSVYNPAASLFGVVVALTVGFVFLFVTLAGAVECGIRRAFGR